MMFALFNKIRSKLNSIRQQKDNGVRATQETKKLLNKKEKLPNLKNGQSKKTKKFSDNKKEVSKRKRSRKYYLIRNICSVIILILLLDLIVGLILYLFEFRMPYYSFIFSIIIFVEIIFIILFIIFKLLIYNKKRSLDLKALKKTYKRFYLWCRSHNVKFKKIPCFLVIGNPGSGKSTFLQKGRYNLLDSSSQKNKNMKMWVSRSSMAISVNASRSNIKSSVLEAVLQIMQKRNDNTINAIIVTISADTILELPEEKLADFVKDISGYLVSVLSTLKRKIPVYFLITKCDKIVGTNPFFSTLSQVSKQDVFGYTSKLKNDEKSNLASVSNGLDEIVLNLENMRQKLLMHIKLPDTFRERLDHTDSFYPFTFNIKNIVHKMKGLLGEVFADFSHNNMDFPFRGLYFISSNNAYASKSSIGVNSVVSETDINAEDTKEILEEGSLFLTDVIAKIISQEVNTSVPISREFYEKRMLKRLILIVAIIVFCGLSYYSYISYIYFKSQVNNVYDLWKVTNNKSNWNFKGFLPVVSYKVAAPNQKIAANNKKSSQYRTFYLDPMVKMKDGKSVYEYLSNLFTAYNSTNVEYPLFFKPYNWLDSTNLHKKEVRALRQLFVTSFLHPIFEIYLDTYFHEKITWNKTTYNALRSLIKFLGKVDMSKSPKAIFINWPTTEEVSPKYITDVVDFVYKNNTSKGKYDLSDILKYSNIITREAYKFNLNSHMNIPWADALGVDNFIKNSSYVNNKREFELYAIKKFQDLLDFPLVVDKNFDTKITYDDFLRANSILGNLNTSAEIGKKHKKFSNMLAWAQTAKKLAKSIISADYFLTNSKFYLESYSETQNTLKNSVNAGEIVVSLNFSSGKNVSPAIITRAPIDQYFFSIDNEYSYPKTIFFYDKFTDINSQHPIAKLELPKYWTTLYLLFNGPNLRPINSKLDYWVTWTAAEHIRDNQWKTKIRIIGENNNEYNLYLKFTLDYKIAEEVKALYKLHKKQKDSLN